MLVVPMSIILAINFFYNLLNPQEEILHLEFQVAPVSVPPMPIRMLDYYARLRRQYSFYPIEQVIIYLKETTSNAVFIEQFTDTNTVHRFRSIRIWEQLYKWGRNS